MPVSPCYSIIEGSGFAPRAEAAGPAATPYGDASAGLRRVRLGHHEVLWLPRHGDGHAIPPHRINYRANLHALEVAGATAVIAMNTVGVITGRLRPGDIVIPAQLIDYTWGREHTYFDGTTGEVRHVEFSAPFTPALRERLLHAAGAAGIDCVDGGVYAVTQGPRLETPAEIDRLERDGADMVGMTAMPEAVLAAELGLEYAVIGLAVNPAAGRTEASLHAEVEKYSRAARDKAEALLAAFFGSDS